MKRSTTIQRLSRADDDAESYLQSRWAILANVKMLAIFAVGVIVGMIVVGHTPTPPGTTLSISMENRAK